ncbi:diacylglyceryl transferase [Myroides ceti]|uniref:Diacylglyceryl transferase n=1 Tax=Paenimyroides ceti TaxID=395087 RepID=A0ABT8CUM8_9FLAO|nr:DUF6787 family protein [Paenimyroides ceti]MDN3707701.1 diacylglyceryl transferase [Paenimyroides ceti]
MASLKERWGVKSNVQFTIILVVFAITGSTSAYITKPIMEFLGITKDVLPLFFYYILKIVLILPVYKVLLILIGTIFGQHQFFWNFIKKMLTRMGMGFLYGTKSTPNQ